MEKNKNFSQFFLTFLKRTLYLIINIVNNIMKKFNLHIAEQPRELGYEYPSHRGMPIG